MHLWFPQTSQPQHGVNNVNFIVSKFFESVNTVSVSNVDAIYQYPKNNWNYQMGFRCPSTENHFSSMNELFCQTMFAVLSVLVLKVASFIRAHVATLKLYIIAGFLVGE